MYELALQLIREAKEKRATSLDLGNCGLRELPEELFELVWLEELVLGNHRTHEPYNFFSALPSELKQLQGLKKLNVRGGNNLQPDATFPIKDLSPLKYLTELEVLNLSFTQISDIKPLNELHKLKELDIAYSMVCDLSPLVGLYHLQKLYFGSTKIDKLDPLSELRELKKLELRGIHVRSLHPLKDLHQLQWLMLSSSQVSDLGPLKGLHRLQTLFLSHTQVSDLNPLKDLHQLQRLKLNSTQVSDLSPLKILENLQELSVVNCPIPYIPKEITEQDDCAHDLKAYWKDLDNSQAETNTQLKVMFLGNGCVGKTTLLHWFIDNSFKDLSLESGRTHGIIIQPWLFQESGMLANFWDFGGQEVYHATHRLFLGRRTLYLLVWAIETPEQHPEERHPPQYWLDMIADIAAPQERSRVIIVQNRFEGQTVQNMLDNEALEAYSARGLDITPLSVEAKKGDNIKTFKAQVEEAATQLLAAQPENLPQSWVSIRRAVAERRTAGNKTMPWSDFVQVCDNCGLQSDPAVISGYLHRAGEVFHYPDQFDNQLILDQQWALKAVYAILKKDKIARFKGVFQLEDLLEIWQEGHPGMSTEEAKVFLNFMLGNKIMFYAEKDGAHGNKNPEFVVPQLLPEEKPSMWKLWDDIPGLLWHRIQYAFLHRDIIERFMVQTAYLSKEKAWWRNGLFIEYEGDKAMVEVLELDNSKVIQIRCTGATKEKLLQTIREEFHKVRPLEKATEYQQVQGVWQPWSATARMLPDDKSGFPKPEDRLDKMEAILEKISSFVEKNTANMETVSLKAHLKKLVAQAKRKEAIDMLMEWAGKNDESLYNETIGVSARLTSLEREIHGSTISSENAKVSMAQITGSINYLIDMAPNGVTVQVSAAPAAPPQPEEPPPPPQPAPAAQPAKVEILMLTANPVGTTKLSLDTEQKHINKKLKNDKDKFNLNFEEAVDSAGFKEFIEIYKPSILHFSGHGEPGGADGGIRVHSDDHRSGILMPPDGLSVLFEYFKEEKIDIQAVVLNACYSEEQAQAIAAHVPYVIGTTVAVADSLAIAFSVGFYFKLVAEVPLNIEKSFRSGRAQAAAIGADRSNFVLYKNNQKLEI